MRKTWWLSLVSGVLAMVLAASAVAAGEVEDVLPETTVFMLKASDWSQTQKDIKDTALGKIFAEEDVREYLKGVDKVIDQFVARLEKQTGIKKGDFRKAFGTEISVALLGFQEASEADKKAARLERYRAALKGNLRQIGLACHMYADDHDEKFPANLKALIPAYVDNRKVLLCPAYAKHAADGIDYAYVVGLVATDPGSFVMGYENVPGEKGKRLVLFADAHIEELTKEQFDKRWAEQQAALKKAGRKISVVEPKGLARAAKPDLTAIHTGQLPPSMALSLLARVGDAEAAARLTATIQKLTTGGRKARPIAWGAVKGVAIRIERKLTLYVFGAGGYQAWVFSTGGDYAKDLAGALAAGKCAAPLSAAADFKLCRSKLGKRVDLLWYLSIKRNVKRLLSMVPERDRAQAGKIMAALRLEDMVAAASALSVEAPGFRSRTFLACKPGETGALQLLDTDPLPREFLKLIPANVAGTQAGAMRFDRLIPLIRSVAAASGKDGAKPFDAALENLKKHMGIDVEKGILGALGRRGCVYMLPAAAVGGNPMLGQLNGLTVILEVKDPVALRVSVAKLVEIGKAAMAAQGMALAGPDGAPQGVTTFEYRGQKVTYFNLGMVAPGFAITGKYMIVGGNVQAVKKAVARLAKGEKAEPGLVDSDIFKKAMKRLPEGGGCSLTYLDVGSSTATGMATVGMMAGLMLPAMGRVRTSARRATSKSNLRQIGLACHMYADDNDEKFPPNLKVLMPDYVDNAKVYKCPTYSKHAANGIDYAYVAGLQATDAGSIVLAYEPVASGPGKGGANVLFCDAHVEWMTIEALKKMLAKQMAKHKKDGRKITIIEPKGVGGGAPGAVPVEMLTEDGLLALVGQLANPATMPPPEAITKHLFPSVATARKVEGGILYEGFSPLGFDGGPALLGGPQNLAAASIIAAIAIPSLLSARKASLETNAIGSLRAYCSAQTMYKRNDWDGNGVLEYAKTFTVLQTQVDGNGEPIQLIDAAFAAAKGAEGVPKHGYIFQDMKTIGGKKIDRVNDHALCARPAVYGRTGYRTFIVTTNGTVFCKDLGAAGKFVSDYPADPAKAGWVVANGMPRRAIRMERPPMPAPRKRPGKPEVF